MIRNDREQLAFPMRIVVRSKIGLPIHKRAARAHRIESHRLTHTRKHGAPSSSPGRPSGLAIPHIHQLANAVLRLPRLSGEVVEIGDVEAWFIALGIQADQSGCIGKLPKELKL